MWPRYWFVWKRIIQKKEIVYTVYSNPTFTPRKDVFSQTLLLILYIIYFCHFSGVKMSKTLKALRRNCLKMCVVILIFKHLKHLPVQLLKKHFCPVGAFVSVPPAVFNPLTACFHISYSPFVSAALPAGHQINRSAGHITSLVLF